MDGAGPVRLASLGAYCITTSGQISAAMMMMMITKEAGAQQRDVGICTCWDSDDDDHR